MKSENDTSKTISLLRKILLDPNCSRMNQSTVKGFYGELLVKQKLEQEGFVVRHKGNQAGYDLEFDLDGKTIKIDVKLSSFKNELGRKFKVFYYWGWALRSESKKRDISCSYYICVALQKDFKPNVYYLINAKLVHDGKFPKAGIKQFKSVLQAFAVAPKGAFLPELESVKEYFQECELLLKRGLVRKVLPNEHIRTYL